MGRGGGGGYGSCVGACDRGATTASVDLALILFLTSLFPPISIPPPTPPRRPPSKTSPSPPSIPIPIPIPSPTTTPTPSPQPPNPLLPPRSILHRNKLPMINRPRMHPTTRIMRPRTAIQQRAGMARLPAAGETAGHAGVVAVVAEVAFCGVGGYGFELGLDCWGAGRGGGLWLVLCGGGVVAVTAAVCTIQLG